MADEGIHIGMENGVSQRTGEGFVTITIHSGDEHGKVLGTGQLSPTELRTHALYCLEAAEAAEQDAATLAVMQEVVGGDERGMQMAALVVMKLRSRRDPR